MIDRSASQIRRSNPARSAAIALAAVLVVAACGGSPAVSSPTGATAPGIVASPGSASTPSTAATTSAEPTDSPEPTDPPLVVSPLPSPGKPTVTAGAKFTAHAGETNGHATLTLNQWAGANVAGPVIQKTDFSVPCLWTSRTSVRGAFYQRLRILGQNDVLVWSAGAATDGPAMGSVTIFPDGPGMATADEQYPSEAVEIDAPDGLVSGMATFRSLTVAPEMTTVGGAFVNGSIEWDCGSAPAGAPGAVAAPSAVTVEGTVTVGSRSTSRPMDPGCGGTYFAADGTPAEIPNCDSTWSPIPASGALTLPAGTNIVVATRDADLVSTFSRAVFVSPSAAVPDGASGAEVPQDAAAVAPVSVGATSLAFASPGKGDWYVFIPLICVDGQGDRFEYWWAARIFVE